MKKHFPTLITSVRIIYFSSLFFIANCFLLSVDSSAQAPETQNFLQNPDIKSICKPQNDYAITSLIADNCLYSANHAQNMHIIYRPDGFNIKNSAHNDPDWTIDMRVIGEFTIGGSDYDYLASISETF